MKAGADFTSTDALGVATLAAGLLSAFSLMLAVLCFVHALIAYRNYRRNPVDHPISKMFLLLLMGGILLGLVLIHELMHSGTV